MARSVALCVCLLLMSGGLAAQSYQSAIDPNPPTSEQPIGNGDCATGIVHDDDSFENGYSGNPAVVTDFGIVDLFQPVAGEAYNRICICFTANSAGISGTVDVSIYDDNSGGVPGGLLANESFPIANVPGFPGGQWYSFDLTTPYVSDGADYVGVRFDPTQFGGPNVFVCADESAGTPMAGGYVELLPPTPWGPIGVLFPLYRSMLIRAETGAPAPAVPGTGVALLALLLLLGSYFVLRSRQQNA